MYYYFRSEPGLWTVAHGEHPNINPDSDWANREDAAKRVHYLNGGADEKLHAEKAWLRGLVDKYESRTENEAYMEMEAIYLLTRDERDNVCKNLAATQDRLTSAERIINNIDFQKIGEMLGLRLGEDVSPHIVPAIQKMSADISELKKALNQAVEDKKSLAEVIFMWQNEPERTTKWYSDYIAIRDGYGKESHRHGHSRYVEILRKITAAGIPLARRDTDQLL